MRNKLPGQTMIAVEEHELARLREIAGCFEKGDAAILSGQIKSIEYAIKCGEDDLEYIKWLQYALKCLHRLQKAAKLAEDGA